MKNITKVLALLLAGYTGQGWAMSVDTPEYYLCAHKVSNTPWEYGTVPSWCDVDPFASPDVITTHFTPIIFDAHQTESEERERYMSTLYPVVREAAEYYLDNRKPNASITEKGAWLHAVMAVASIETKWSHYRNDDLDDRIKMIRGDLGHGHGMMQVDDRWHFTAIEEGKGVQFFENMVYALDIFYNGWHYAPGQSCVDGENDWEARSRSAYSAYNGGPTDWCRWYETPYTQDNNFIAHYSAKEWEDFVEDKNAAAELDTRCYMEDNASCIASADDGGQKLRIGQLSEGTLGSLMDGIDGVRLEYIRGPENAWSPADRFLELERDGEWVKVELMKYADVEETPYIGWVHDVGNITWTDVSAVGTLQSNFPATFLELQDGIDGTFLGKYVRSQSNAWNPADRVVLLQRDGNWAQVEVLRYADNDETPIIGWVIDNGNFDWIEGQASLTQLVGYFGTGNGTIQSLTDDIDGEHITWVRTVDNAWEAAARFMLLERQGDYVKVEVFRFEDGDGHTARDEVPLIGWLFDGGSITWQEVPAIGALLDDFPATILELHDAIDGNPMGQYVRSYSNAWNPGDRVALIEEDPDSDWVKVEVMRYLDADETPNIGWVLGGDSFTWVGGIEVDDEPTLAELWQYKYLSMPTGELCLLHAGEYHCAASADDAVCLNVTFDRVTDEEYVMLSTEEAALYNKVMLDRHQCLANVPMTARVGDVIRTTEALTLYDKAGAAGMSSMAQQAVTTDVDGVYQVLDVVVTEQNVYNRYYRIMVGDVLGYIYAGNDIDIGAVEEADISELPMLQVLVPQPGQWIEITNPDGIVLRDDTDVSGKAQALINQGKVLEVEETIVKGDENRVYYKVTAQNVLGFLYGGMVSEATMNLSDWAVVASEPDPVDPPTTPTPSPDDAVEVRPLSKGGSLFWLVALMLPLALWRNLPRRRQLA